MDKIRDDLAYFKGDFWNEEMFKAISRWDKGTSTPNPLDGIHWRPWVLLHPEGTPFQGLPQYHHHRPLWCHLQGPTPVPSLGLHHLDHLGVHLCHHHDQYLSQEGLHHPEISLNHSHNLSLSLSLLQYWILMVGRHSEPPHQICPQITTHCQTMESSLSTETHFRQRKWPNQQHQ